MAKDKKRKGKAGKDAAKASQARDRDIDVQLLPTVEVLHKHLTEALCEEVFQDVRKSDRQRKWSLFAMARFWLAVIVQPPPSLSDLLERTRRIDPRGLLPHVEAKAQAFFARAEGLSSVFFAQVFSRFVDKILPQAPKVYCPQIAHLDAKFTQILVFDGSRLDKLAYRLKILWAERAAVLPGCLLAAYDLGRGFAQQLWFGEDAASSEYQRAMVACECLDPNTLVLGDRLYCSPKLFRAPGEQQCFGLVRCSKAVKVRIKRRLSRSRDNGGSGGAIGPQAFPPPRLHVDQVDRGGVHDRANAQGQPRRQTQEAEPARPARHRRLAEVPPGPAQRSSVKEEGVRRRTAQVEVLQEDQGRRGINLVAMSLMEISATAYRTPMLRGIAWSADGKHLARYRSQSARYDEVAHTLYYSWEGEHPGEEAVPEYFGVGEMVFRFATDEVVSGGEGWYSSSMSSAVKESLTKSTVYIRASAAEVATMQGTARDKRASLVQARLAERDQLDV